MAATGDDAVRAEGLARTFGETEAVAGIDLKVAPGEIYGFLGPNGAGKSTTVKMLCTLLLPTGGTAHVAGFDVATQAGEVRLRIGAALQEASLDAKQSGRELLRLQGRLYGLTKPEIDERVVSLAELVDIGDALDRRIGTYSGGMKRRLDLAAALVHNPDVLFLDEPTSGLDPISRPKIWDEVRRLNTELGTTIFLTTQYLEEADRLADRVGIINEGLIVAEGAPADLKRQVGDDLIVLEISEDAAPEAARVLEGVPGVEGVSVVEREVIARTPNGPATLSPAAVALASAGVSVEALTLRTPTLDDVFVELTGARIGEEEAGAAAMSEIHARRPGFFADLISVASRAVRRLPREPELIIPALIIPIFFYVVNVGAIGDLAERGSGLDYAAFQLPGAIIFAVTGVSQANALVVDIKEGYFDRLLMTPVKRLALLLGLMVADVLLVLILCVPVVVLGFLYGVSFETGLLGAVCFFGLSAAWGLAFTGFPYAIALKTGNPSAVASSFILFFPFAFLTTSFLPYDDLAGWLQTAADVNPVTYVLAGLRSFLYGGWNATDILSAVAAIAIVGSMSIGLALLALRGRVSRG